MNQRLWIFLAASAFGAALALGACGGDSLPSDTQSTATSTSGAAGPGATTTTTAGPGSSSGGGMGGANGTGGGGGGGGAPDCFTNPMTHVEIINACTTADKIDKMSTLPLLGPNGELPPLP
jgi:hypothetical protein